jgi:uncharacterized protein DUF4062
MSLDFMAFSQRPAQMTHPGPPVPRQFLGVMVSSTFTDFERHREALIAAVSGQALHPIAMEQDSALPGETVIESSLRKVREGAAYVGIIGMRYGEVPDSTEHNPDGLSLTELEFREARDLGRPILLFIMGPDHDVKSRDVELDPAKRNKLDNFREEAKNSSAGSRVHRIYKVFNSLGEFEVAATQSVAELRRFLDAEAAKAGQLVAPIVADSVDGDNIPAPPALYAEPRYIGSHAFVGRAAQLATLNDWAASAEAHPVLLFEAIGGTGKSMLTWEWATRHAGAVRDDWAGVFWYSFYEKGAVMSDFCRRALTYMTGRPLETFRKKRQPELSELLTRQLQARPWLLILDGLERVLVAYHRYDAAQLADEQAGLSDEIARRDPCNAIRPLDDELLRQMAADAPSKILITSRLVPRVLVNAASQPIPGVLHERLPGLRPVDAEALLRTCGVRGDSQQIQDYLQRHCDCHPLVTGVVAGLINDYLPDRGHFDAWAADPDHGGRLDLGHLDLIQKRNHILTVALEALPDASRQLLSTLSLLPESFDYAILAALNPHRPPEPAVVPEPAAPEDGWIWHGLSDEEQELARREYAAEIDARREYERAHAAWRSAAESRRVTAALTATVRDLEQRGLLQYDQQAGRWDLHPVVRAVAVGGLPDPDRDQLGQQIIDHFSQRPHDPYEQARTLDDVRDAITVVRTLLQIGRKEEAWSALNGQLIDALLLNIEAYAESLSLLRSFFPHSWTTPAESLTERDISLLASSASAAFAGLGEDTRSLELNQVAVRIDVKNQSWENVQIDLSSLSKTTASLNKLVLCERYSLLGLRLAEAMGNPELLFNARLDRCMSLGMCGRWDGVEEMWDLLDPMGRDWPRTIYRPGTAEICRLAYLLFPCGRLTEEHLAAAERLARNGYNRYALRHLHNLRGEWRLVRSEYSLSVPSLQEAIGMAHEAGFPDSHSETMLALARFHLHQLPAAHEEASRLSAVRDPAHLMLAELWHALGDADQAIKHAKAAYGYASADGEPYVRRYRLDEAKALLQKLGEDIPELPAYDPAQYPKDLWEEQIAGEIAERLKSVEPGI